MWPRILLCWNQVGCPRGDRAPRRFSRASHHGPPQAPRATASRVMPSPPTSSRSTHRKPSSYSATVTLEPDSKPIHHLFTLIFFSLVNSTVNTNKPWSLEVIINYKAVIYDLGWWQQNENTNIIHHCSQRTWLPEDALTDSVCPSLSLCPGASCCRRENTSQGVKKIMVLSTH